MKPYFSTSVLARLTKTLLFESLIENGSSHTNGGYFILHNRATMLNLVIADSGAASIVDVYLCGLTSVSKFAVLTEPSVEASPPSQPHSSLPTLPVGLATSTAQCAKRTPTNNAIKNRSHGHQRRHIVLEIRHNTSTL